MAHVAGQVTLIAVNPHSPSAPRHVSVSCTPFDAQLGIAGRVVTVVVLVTVVHALQAVGQNAFKKSSSAQLASVAVEHPAGSTAPLHVSMHVLCEASHTLGHNAWMVASPHSASSP